MSRSQSKAVSRYQALRSEVMSLSPAMAAAMLDGIGRQRVVTGQYTDGDGGACPLLAANRAGAPLHRLTNFPKTWDAFCGLRHARQARPASPHELHMLRLLLEARLMPAGERTTSPQPRTPRFTAPRPRRLERSVDWQAELSSLLGRVDQQIAG